MIITFTKISDREHQTQVSRSDGSTETVRLSSRSFVRHDFAHLAIEMEIPLRHGFWGSVARGAPLSGKNETGQEIADPELALAEQLAGPVQTLIRMEAPVDQYLHILNTTTPDLAQMDLAQRIHERCRRLMGHWRATPYRADMVIEWPEEMSG